MALPNLFSRRRRQAEATPADVYTYHEIPEKTKRQIVLILRGVIGEYSNDSYSYSTHEIYEYIVTIFREETGLFQLTPNPRNLYDEFFRWFLSGASHDDTLDALELSLRLVDGHLRNVWHKHKDVADREPDEAIEAINARLREAAIGYEYAEGMLIQLSNEHLHRDVVVPALRLLGPPEFAAANEEYREAHSHFRSGDFETCLVDCGKAFESTLKVIATKRKWSIKDTDPASKLIAAAFDSGFVPAWMQAQFTALRSLLESGVPTVRNKQGGHGAGTQPRTVPRELAEYQLNQTAAVISFLVKHDKATP